MHQRQRAAADARFNIDYEWNCGTATQAQRQPVPHLRAVFGGIVGVPVVRRVHATVAVDHLKDVHLAEVGPASGNIRHHPVRWPYALRCAVAARVYASRSTRVTRHAPHVAGRRVQRTCRVPPPAVKRSRTRGTRTQRLRSTSVCSWCVWRRW